MFEMGGKYEKGFIVCNYLGEPVVWLGRLQGISAGDNKGGCCKRAGRRSKEASERTVSGRD